MKMSFERRKKILVRAKKKFTNALYTADVRGRGRKRNSLNLNSSLLLEREAKRGFFFAPRFIQLGFHG